MNKYEASSAEAHWTVGSICDIVSSFNTYTQDVGAYIWYEGRWIIIDVCKQNPYTQWSEVRAMVKTALAVDRHTGDVFSYHEHKEIDDSVEPLTMQEVRDGLHKLFYG